MRQRPVRRRVMRQRSEEGHMTCFLCGNELLTEDGAQHLCVKDNSALFKERRAEMDTPSEFAEYTDELDFFDAVQIVGESE